MIAPRIIACLGAALLAGSCSTAPIRETRSPRAERELAEALAGRTAGTPVRCISGYKSYQMQVIDDWTILFRNGRTTYVQKPRGGCLGLSSAGRTLVTRPFGTNQMCDGDINHSVDLVSRMPGGSCVFGPFVPYTKPK